MKIAVWYHAKLTGPEFGIDTKYSVSVLEEQMSAYHRCELAPHVQEFHVGLNEDIYPDRVSDALPKNCHVMFHGKQARSELPTLHALQKWLPGHEDWLVLYWHSKGITHPHDKLNEVWRRCMEREVIWSWMPCVVALKAGYDCAGPHWLTREKYGPLVKTFFFGGNFWWAKASFLLKLPYLKSNSQCREDDFMAETWIGSGPRPNVRCVRDHWPGFDVCTKGASR